MNILITGATGFIGRQLVNSLLGQSLNLTALSRQSDKVVELFADRVTAINALSSLTSKDNFDAIINLAGEPIADARWTDARKQKLWDSRVTLTDQLIDFISRADQKPKALISGSAIGYYGNQGDALINEDSGFQDEYAHKLCAAWEETALRAKSLGVRVCVIRTGLVVGNNGGFLKRLLMPFKFGLGGRIGDGQQWMSWIHINDLVAMIEVLLKSSDLSGAFNGTAPQPVTNQEFTQCLAEVLNRPALLPVPAWVLRLAMGEMSTLMLGGQRVLPERFLNEGFQFEFDALKPALEHILKH